ncbi:CGNR zinc finger domain-containing protein [Streptomyces sp. DSM 44915]|uniref:CGNR zinc finger domain-containing protein n=1 Tax=Streptomyces chisholmiae TaxID=3075540 RepID=A0ABU2JII8_9ACTN|nr:CGNR zinc finger domain-containing protein [Streptomyces sp. DSM 44915]MDT0264800.1 CGNR zinc finger domain-containing protein [Streptomyces sp. DSM 44915]
MSAPVIQPAHRLVELANAVRADPALPRAELAALLVRHGERPADVRRDRLTEADAAALRAAAGRLADVLAEPDTDRAAEALNALLAECGARPRLSRHDGQRWHLHVDRGEDASWADWFTASSAHALAQLLSERGGLAWGACAAPACGRLFLALGPGSRRRHCSPGCANRARVAAHRRRHRPTPDG